MSRPPKWHKPRTALAVSLGFGAFVVSGAVVWAEPQMVIFGSICGGYGLLVYGFDCGMQRLLNGVARPPDVFRSDVWWTAALVSFGTVLGVLSPLYV